MLAQQKKKKTGLSVTSVSKDHWSVGGHVAKTEGCRLVVTILHGKGLLASDVFTGKSDPICFLWCGPAVVPSAGAAISRSTAATATASPPNDEANEIMAETDIDKCAALGILRTSVCPTTLEPVWNEDIVFPLSIDDTYSLSQLRIVIYVRDEDIDEVDGGEESSYDELGMCEISLKDILMNGKARRQSISDVSRHMNLKSSPKMKKKAEGYIKVTCTLIFDESECKKLYPEVADGINSLEGFVLKYQQLLKDRNEKENGPQTLWGRAPSPQTGTRRTPGALGDSGGDTNRTSRTSRTSRSRSPQMLQVAPKIRTSAPNKDSNNNDSSSSVDEEKESRDGRGGGGGRPSRVPRLDYNKRSNDEHIPLQDLLEGDEEEEEGRKGDESELLVISEGKDGKQEKVEGPEEAVGIEGKEGDKDKVGDEGIRERRRESKSESKLERKDREEKHEKSELESDAINNTDASSSNNISPKGASPPGISPLGLLSSLPSMAPSDARGTAAVAARSLRDQKETKQQSIEYLAKLSPESIAELTQLLSAMDGQKQEKSKRGDVLPRSDSDVGSNTGKDGGKDIGITKKRTSSAKNGRKSDTDKSIDATDGAEDGLDGKKKSVAAGRPDLKEFKRQQQEAKRRAKEQDSFESNGLSQPTQPGSRGSSKDNNSMPVVELLLKAPNSGEIMRATLEPGGMVMAPRDVGKDGARDGVTVRGGLGANAGVRDAWGGDKGDGVRDGAMGSEWDGDPPDGDYGEPPDIDEGQDLAAPSYPSLSPSYPQQAEGISPSSSSFPLKPINRQYQTNQPNQASHQPVYQLPYRNDGRGDGSSSSSSGGGGMRISLQGSGNVDWAAVQQCLGAGDALGAFSLVLERGELEDLARVMEAVGPKPYLLSLSIRSRVYDGIASILSQSQLRSKQDPNGDRLTERCLFWILALLRGRPKEGKEGVGLTSVGDKGLGVGVSAVSGHTRRDLREALDSVSGEKSKRGLLAALLIHYF